ncbi:hypothetical protein ACT17_27995 [Mycolicibacterium conceptionense]|uniref:Uncharacterized protein n=2 Tax=Mycolicibacterium conceptionense TaxID=451644 RepID=A0A0J8U303_9MYCO|nr:hypothetical protein ACT17_27995 [Mycolicibacterium conceptionense]
MDSYHWKYATRIRQYPQTAVLKELEYAFRIAFLSSEHLYISASALMENAHSRTILKRHRTLIETGHVTVIGAEETLQEHNETKLKEHYHSTNEPEVRESYKRRIRMPIPYEERAVEVGETIHHLWMRQLESGIERFFVEGGCPSTSDTWWERVPSMLEGAAFVAPHILEIAEITPKLFPRPPSLYSIADAGYAEAHCSNLAAALISDLVYLDLTDASLLGDVALVSYKRAREALARNNLLDFVRACSAEELLGLRSSISLTQLIHSKTESDNAIVDLGQHDSRARPNILYLHLEAHMGDSYNVSHISGSSLNLGSFNNNSPRLEVDSAQDALVVLEQLRDLLAEHPNALSEIAPVQKALEAGDTEAARTRWDGFRQALTTTGLAIGMGERTVHLIESISNFLN